MTPIFLAILQLWLVEAQATSAHRPRTTPSEWEIVFAEDTTAEEYARQLDFFDIELGAEAKNGRVEYLAGLNTARARKRSGMAIDDKRWRISWQSGTLAAHDRRLLAKAGITSDGKQLWHYFPKELEARLVQLELDYAGHPASEIKRTRFGVRPKGASEYEFFVMSQDPPRPSGKTKE